MNDTLHATDAVAAQAQVDLTTAYNVAAGLTPTATGLGDLTGQSIAPGVYSGAELPVTGALALAGTAESVWVFQAASTLTVASGAIITVTGGASACNVFWQVGSSATLDPGARFVGTVMADASITAPTSCNSSPGIVTTTPAITSGSPDAGAAGADYSYTITATGSPAPAVTITGGSLPPGLTLDSITAVISGQPARPASTRSRSPPPTALFPMP